MVLETYTSLLLLMLVQMYAAERHAQQFIESILQIRNQRIRIKFQGTVDLQLRFFDQFIRASNEHREFTITADDLSDDNPNVGPADQNATPAYESIGGERYYLLFDRMAETCKKYLTFEYRSSSSLWVPVKELFVRALTGA